MQHFRQGATGKTPNLSRFVFLYILTGVIQAKNLSNAKYANLELLVSNECRLIKNVHMTNALQKR